MNKFNEIFKLRKSESYFLYFLRWTARILSAVCFIVLLLFIFGENGDPSNITVKQIIGFIFFPVGFMFGLILGFWKELSGGAISVGGVAALYLVYGLMFSNSLWLGWWFAALAVPGALFLIYGILSNLGRTFR